MAVTPTFPSRDSLRRLRFRPLDAVVGAGVFLLIYAAVRVGATARVPIQAGRVATIDTSPSRLPYYAARSLLRMFVALFFAYTFSLGYAYVAARNQRARRVMIPALDILQSVPILGFLAVTVTFFLALFPGPSSGWRRRRSSPSSPPRPGTSRFRSTTHWSRSPVSWTRQAG